MKKLTKRTCFRVSIFLTLVLFSHNYLYANDLSITNINVGEIDEDKGNVDVAFTVSWKNSWRLSSTAPNNWDAVWVFIKYQDPDTKEWHHAILERNDNIVNDDDDVLLPNPTLSISDDTGTGFGVGGMIFSDGSADLVNEAVSYDVVLKWNYEENGLDSNSSFNVQVLGIEMVYINEGAYLLGSGGSEIGHFYDVSTSNDPYLVENENEIAINNTDGLYYGIGGGGDAVEYRGDQSGPIPLNFPKGFKAIYCMKYEIVHGEYVNFINSLTDTYKQKARAATTSTKRHSISGGGVNGYSTEAPYRAYNFLSWADLSAYLDWVGLRPMTELEFEKISRGPNTNLALIVNNEYVWGTTDIYESDYILREDDGGKYTSILDSMNAGNVNYWKGNIARTTDLGPFRAGVFANAISTRLTSGAAYYGVMQLGGNLRERVITIGNTTGRSFTGVHGDGEVSDGLADVLNWPDSAAVGSGMRGSSFWENKNLIRISDRTTAARPHTGEHGHYGGRGVRTAE